MPTFIIVGWSSLLCFLAVTLGAFGSHGVKATLLANQTVDIWEKAVYYHFFHALAILGLANLSYPIPRGIIYSFIMGIVLFSFSLYLLAFTNIRWFGAITPLGGIFFLIGWSWLFIYSCQYIKFKESTKLKDGGNG